MTRTIDLTGKVALVTGGGRGIGKAIAARLADAGAGVVIASRKKENLEAAAAELSGLTGKVVPIACHLGKLEPGTGRHPGQQQRHQRGAGACARRHRRHA
jgi:NAD(P)-dependent dehydrogenase (short-subunit alcohol dehydrogenase family)